MYKGADKLLLQIAARLREKLKINMIRYLVNYLTLLLYFENFKRCNVALVSCKGNRARFLLTK